MSSLCEECTEIQRLEFRIKGQDLDIKDVQQTQLNKDIEHEQMIQNLTNRMDTVSQDLVTFKKEVKADIQEVRTVMKQDIQSIKNDIPEMFDNAVNKLLAKMFRYVLWSIFAIICVIMLAFSRPLVLKGIDEVKSWVESVEVPNGK